MKLTIIKGRRNLQEIYDLVVEAYNKNEFSQMKELAFEFVNETRSSKEKTYKFNKVVSNTNVKDKLLMFITNLHMQDSKETASL
jgi:hypothetical protein